MSETLETNEPYVLDPNARPALYDYPQGWTPTVRTTGHAATAAAVELGQEPRVVIKPIDPDADWAHHVSAQPHQGC